MSLKESTNKLLQRSVRHKVLSRRRPSLVPALALHARALTSQPAAAELNR